MHTVWALAADRYHPDMANRFTTVDDFLAAQPEDVRAQVDTLRALAVEANPALVEIVKWNSPSFVLDGEDRLTVSVGAKQTVRLVLHLGTEIDEDKGATPDFAGDPEELLTWHSNIRASLVAPERDSDREAVVGVIRNWLAQ